MQKPKVEIERRREQQLLRLLVDAVQDYAIFMLDANGQILSWSVGAQRMYGCRDSEIIGRHFSCLFSEEDIRAGKPQRQLETAAREGRMEDESWRLREDGSKLWVNVIIAALKDADGNITAFGTVARDATVRLFAQRGLEESRQKLQESERSLRQLSLHLQRTQDEERRRIGRELHDSLGQYLGVLKMKLDSLVSEPQMNGADLKQCAHLAEEAVKEVRTISYLLYPPMLEEMGLKSAIPWYLEGFRKRSGIQTTFDVSAAFRRLPGEIELALFRILQESLTNVHRHSGSATAEVQLETTDDEVVLKVSDKGKGFAESDQDCSIGVGLRGMSERMRQLGGRLELSSTAKGTTVVAAVSVPKGAEVAQPPTRVRPVGLFPAKPKILVVDDHEIVREGIRTLLYRSRPDWDICGEASNADEALNAVKQLEPDILILDITMPGISGLEVARQISTMGLRCRILVFTMHDSERLQTEVRGVGAHGYVLKSQAAHDLIFAIEHVLAGGTFFGAPPEAESVRVPSRN